MSTVDLATTLSGDIYFENAVENNSLRLTYNLRFDDIQSLRLSFMHSRAKIPDITERSLNLSFNYDDESEKVKAACVFDNNATKKQLEYAIRSTLTDLKENSDFGSDMELYIHSNLRDKNVLANIETIISDAIAPILSSPTVRVVPKVSLSSNGYFQGILIEIYDDNRLFMTYNLK